jgi:hypothetical protein
VFDGRDEHGEVERLRDESPNPEVAQLLGRLP